MLLRFSKSGKRTVSDGFVKKSADSDSVSDSRHIINLYTPATVEHSTCPLVAANAATMHLAGDRSWPARHNHRPTCRVPDIPRTHARTHARGRPTPPQCKLPHADARRCTMPKPHATHREVQYFESCNSNCNFNYNLFNRTREFFIPYKSLTDRYH